MGVTGATRPPNPMPTDAAALRGSSCRPCEGGVPKLTRGEAQDRLAALDGWELRDGGEAIGRAWKAKDFAAALAFFGRVGELAEAEGHHPDLHLTGYNRAAIELTTHALGGLSENDFILAAKIDALDPPG